MSSGGRNEHTSKSSNRRLLGDDERDKLITTPRLSNGTGKQPAQERLKRLQTQLKRVQDKKPIRNNEKKRETIKRITRSSSTSQIATPDSAPNRRLSAYTSTPKRLTAQTKVVMCASPRNAWEKPKALVDANNRLKAGPSQSANERLTQLRTLLQQKQQNEERNNNDVAKINEKVVGKQAENCNISNPSAFNGSSSSEIKPEPMEWEESIEGESPKKDQDEAKEEDDILQMRQAADGEELPTRLVDLMYFVLDTNVLMQNIKFVESLTELVLPGTVGSMLYIPYIVIKELDKLKSQYNSDNPKRLVAVRAIRYLNTKFDESLGIQAQSAEEEADHLIKVDCPDDSIINCCLQLQDQVPNMMLLTNDENVRLKANASDIQVSCRSDLMSTYADEFAALGD
ncbi:transcriptional protein SWT1 isoform X2 [Drosophila erecta]|uniref:transcriptional protein SWT1 isoform X2 n=1 Tax=Drosophila erecta TaxID=7220 RepID=UPI000F05DAB0|nr:transcriptional protein SWT1 isoform X2 [Drosophila erecta]